jgi:hypothetical protein
MLAILPIVKWASALGILVTIGYGLHFVYEYHLDQIDKAVLAAQADFAIEKQEALNSREAFLREQAQADKEVLELELEKERQSVRKLRKMLLIDHDLDRLLQRKPGLVLPRVNKGTEEVLKELQEITQ